MTPLVFGMPAGAEWIIIVLALLLIFGGSRIAGIGKGTGRAVREFKEEIRAADTPQVAPPTTSGAPVTTTPGATTPVTTTTPGATATGLEATPVDAPRADQVDPR